MRSNGLNFLKAVNESERQHMHACQRKKMACQIAHYSPPPPPPPSQKKNLWLGLIMKIKSNSIWPVQFTYDFVAYMVVRELFFFFSL